MTKINLIYGEGGEIYNGYLTINPFLETETDDVKRGDIKDLSKFVDDGEAEELIAIGVLEYLNSNKIPEVLSHWAKKVSIGGKIIIGLIDSYEVARSFTNEMINIETFNALLHGSGSKPYMIKRTCLTTAIVESLLKQLNFKIMKRKVNHYNMTIEAIRQ